MVKSPWRLLTRLLSRGTSVDRSETEGPGANSSASEVLRASDLTPEPQTLAAPQAGIDDPSDRQEAMPLTAALLPEAVPIDEAITSIPDRDVVKIRSQRRSRRADAQSAKPRKSKAVVSADTKDVKLAKAVAEPARANEPDPVRGLDSEISELRSQLAGKLRLQNDQLREMLRRFEPK